MFVVVSLAFIISASRRREKMEKKRKEGTGKLLVSSV